MAELSDIDQYKQDSSFTGVVPIYKPAGRARGRYISTIFWYTESALTLEAIASLQFPIRNLSLVQDMES